jgi:flagellar hook-associated protein 2
MADGLSVGNVSTAGGQTRLTGTSSNLDTDAIVAAAYAAKRQPAVRLEQRISTNQARATALGELRSLLGTLKDSVAGLRNPPGLLGANDNAFESKQAFLSTSSATAPADLVGVTIANKAAAGSFGLEVQRLAAAHKVVARPLGGATQTLANAWNGGATFSGTLELGLAGGAKATVAIDGAMDVNDLRAAINAVSDRTGVAASVLAVSDTDRRLILTAADTGKAIELADAGGDGITALLGATDLQAPQTARLLVDGVAVERTGNRVADVVDGVTFDLYQAEPGTVVGVKVEPSLASAKQAIQGFVAAYNALRDFTLQQGAVSTDGKVADDAVLFGDRTLRSVTQTLSALVGGATPGLGAGTMTTLRDVGISMVEGGRLKLDETALDGRLLGKLGEVRRVFEFGASSSSGDLSVYARTNALADTSFTVAITDADGDGQAESATIDGVAALLSGGTIQGADGTAYEGLKLIWTGSGSAAIDMRVSPGVADRLYNALDQVLDLTGGPLQRAMGELDAANSDYGKRIDQINERADQARKRLMARFSAMESALSLAKTMLTQVRAQMDATNGQN